MKLTGWYPPEIKPVRKGWYDATIINPPDGAPYPRMMWDGMQWWHPRNKCPCDFQDRWWRGLAEKPRANGRFLP